MLYYTNLNVNGYKSILIQYNIFIATRVKRTCELSRGKTVTKACLDSSYQKVGDDSRKIFYLREDLNIPRRLMMSDVIVGVH